MLKRGLERWSLAYWPCRLHRPPMSCAEYKKKCSSHICDLYFTTNTIQGYVYYAVKKKKKRSALHFESLARLFAIKDKNLLWTSCFWATRVGCFEFISPTLNRFWLYGSNLYWLIIYLGCSRAQFIATLLLQRRTALLTNRPQLQTQNISFKLTGGLNSCAYWRIRLLLLHISDTSLDVLISSTLLLVHYDKTFLGKGEKCQRSGFDTKNTNVTRTMVSFFTQFFTVQ